MGRPDIWRAGNFVLRRREVPTLGADELALSDVTVARRVKDGKIGTVECIEVMSLDGAWMMRLMPGSQMEALMGSMLGEEEVLEDEWITLVLTNLMYASSIPNGHYHQGLMLLTSAYADPSLLRGGRFNRKAKAFRKDVKGLIERFLTWRKDYDAFVASQPYDERQEQVRMEAEALLDEGQNGSPLK